MATLMEVRKAIADVIVSINTEMHGYRNVTDVVQVPAVIVEPRKADFAITMGAGVDEWIYDLYVLVGIPEMGLAQDQLDLYVDGSGLKSIRAIINENPTLGDVVEDSMITAMDKYGSSFETASIPHIGACLTLKVLAIGN